MCCDFRKTNGLKQPNSAAGANQYSGPLSCQLTDYEEGSNFVRYNINQYYIVRSRGTIPET